MVAIYELKEGDHIYTYYHHGIYVGKAKVTNPSNAKKQQIIEHAVIHFLGLSSNTSSSNCHKCFHKSQDVGVVLTCIHCFHQGNSLYRYEYDVSYISFNFKASGTCSTMTCSEPDTVIKRAYEYYKGNKNFGEFHLMFNNSEHFATKCKTGKRASAAGGLPGFVVSNVVRGLTKGIFS